MDDLEDPRRVFGEDIDKSYQKEAVEDIIRYRHEFGDQLFIDRLLKALGINNDITEAFKLYPPRSGLELKKLHERIIGSASPDHHKVAILYYIRKDFPRTARQAADKLARIFHLPQKYKIFVDGLWCLDRFKFEEALDYLTEPTLIPTYPEEILYTFCRHAPKNESSLALAYYHTVSPTITSDDVRDAFFLVLCRSSFAEAFWYCRAQGENVHHRLFHKLIHFVLTEPKGDSRSIRGTILMDLPLNKSEETWMTKYLKEGQGGKLPGAVDTLIMRGLVKGDFKALQDAGVKTTDVKVQGMNWAMLKKGLKRDNLMAPAL